MLFQNFMIPCISAGHFLPDEDDKFLERVRSAVEEEERQAAIAAAETYAARDAISAVIESRKVIEFTNPEANIVKQSRTGSPVKQEQGSALEIERSSNVDATKGTEQNIEGQGFNNAYESVTNLPFEFYHYYHGSNNDMGTLIEVSFLYQLFLLFSWVRTFVLFMVYFWLGLHLSWFLIN